MLWIRKTLNRIDEIDVSLVSILILPEAIVYVKVISQNMFECFEAIMAMFFGNTSEYFIGSSIPLFERCYHYIGTDQYHYNQNYPRPPPIPYGFGYRFPYGRPEVIVIGR